MFEAIGNITPQPQGSDSVSLIGAKSSATAPKNTDTPSEDQAAQAQQKTNTGKQAEQHQVTEKVLEDLAQDIESIHNIGLAFKKSDVSGRFFIKVMDTTTQEVIREIPSEDVLKIAAKMDEMIGILFDKQV